MKKIAVVTGGNGALGSACASELVQNGYQVIIADRSEKKEIDLPVIIFDAKDLSSIARLFDQVQSSYGSPDLLVNCIGVIDPCPSLAVEEASWDHVIDVNLKGVFFCCQKAAALMKKKGGGTIVNISSIAAETAWPERLSYAVSKAGVNQITKTLATEWACDGIRVNAVGPAWVDTELIEPAVAKGFININQIKQAIPMNRIASTEDIAKAVLFFSQDQSSFITGQILYVDGGYLAGSPSIAIRK